MSDLDLIDRARRDHQRRDDLGELSPRYFAYRHEMQQANPTAAAAFARYQRRRAAAVVAEAIETTLPDYPQR